MAIAIDLRRPKDIMRLFQSHAEKVYDPKKLQELLEKHHLTAKWERILNLLKDQDDDFGSHSKKT